MRRAFLFVLILSLIFYLPILINPNLLLSRGNDLEGFFWPLIQYSKSQILTNHQLPLWNNMYFSGTPLLPNPQSPYFYPPNLIFLFLPIGAGFIVSLMLHSIFGGLGFYLLGRKVFKFSELTSFLMAEMFIFSPKMAGYMEAGHFGLALSFSWIPYLLISVFMINQFKKRYLILYAISSAAIFFNHNLTFLIIEIAVSLLYLYLLKNKKDFIKRVAFFVLANLITFGLIAIAVIPQIEWIPQTTRSLLLTVPDIYPKWHGIREFLADVIIPKFSSQDTDPEKWLVIGAFPLVLSLFGLKLVKKDAVWIILLLVIVILISLSNASPFYNYFLGQNWFLTMRVATRVWFLAVVIIYILAALGFEAIERKKLKIVLFALVGVELLAFSWLRIITPTQQLQSLPESAIKFIKADTGLYRVFCLTRCIPQKVAAKENLELVEGYDTLAQINYYKEAWQLTGKYWNYYTLSIPPFGTFNEKLNPDAPSLGDFNVKYLISPYQLTNPRFIQLRQFGKFYIYKNSFFLSRSYYANSPFPEAKILFYSPNFIRVDTSDKRQTKLVLSTVYSKGWVAYLNGVEEKEVLEKPNTLMQVDIQKDTNFVDFKYQPESFRMGQLITLTTILILLFAKKWLWN